MPEKIFGLGLPTGVDSGDGGSVFQAKAEVCWAGQLCSGPVGAWTLPMGNRELLNDRDTLTSVFQKALPSGPVEDAQERVSRRQGSQ